MPGDEGTVWLTAGLGHRFVVVEEASGETLGEFEATHDAIHSIVAAPRPTSPRSAEQWKRTEDDLRKFEQNRANRVKRTWTKRGYDRAPLPPALFADIATYWYNNAATCLVYEEWGSDSTCQLVASCVETNFRRPTPSRSPSLRLRDGVKVDNLTHWISTHRWHAPPEMCYLPFGLKRRWHDASGRSSSSGSETSSSRTRTYMASGGTRVGAR